ncbi:hypothetical protein C8R44DRAFT_892742 [Mycena epipterygia]|nr:hypothetical protein C8R44DRAFT_892742 [Mycena epipterygia]
MNADACPLSEDVAGKVTVKVEERSDQDSEISPLKALLNRKAAQLLELEMKLVGGNTRATGTQLRRSDAHLAPQAAAGDERRALVCSRPALLGIIWTKRTVLVCTCAIHFGSHTAQNGLATTRTTALPACSFSGRGAHTYPAPANTSTSAHRASDVEMEYHPPHHPFHIPAAGAAQFQTPLAHVSLQSPENGQTPLPSLRATANAAGRRQPRARRDSIRSVALGPLRPYAIPSLTPDARRPLLPHLRPPSLRTLPLPSVRAPSLPYPQTERTSSQRTTSTRKLPSAMWDVDGRSAGRRSAYAASLDFLQRVHPATDVAHPTRKLFAPRRRSPRFASTPLRLPLRLPLRPPSPPPPNNLISHLVGRTPSLAPSLPFPHSPKRTTPHPRKRSSCQTLGAGARLPLLQKPDDELYTTGRGLLLQHAHHLFHSFSLAAETITITPTTTGCSHHSARPSVSGAGSSPRPKPLGKRVGPRTPFSSAPAVSSSR